MGNIKDLWSGKLPEMSSGMDLFGGRQREGGLWNWIKDNPFPAIAGASAAGGLYTALAGNKEDMPPWLKRWYADYEAANKQFAGVGDPLNWQPIRFPSAHGGRIGYAGGTDLRNKMSKLLIKLANGTITDEEMIELRNIESASGFSRANEAQGGRIGYDHGGYLHDDEEDDRIAAIRALSYRPRAQEGGLMNLGGMEKDYRQEGGFVPIGGQERADDVPARLSKNEFVFTADAVRAAGGGDIDAGAEVMENVMENLEQGGEISQRSQGLEGARNMFATAQRLEGVL